AARVRREEPRDGARDDRGRARRRARAAAGADEPVLRPLRGDAQAVAARHGGRGYGKPRRRAIALLDRLPAPVRQERLREEAHRELQRPAPLPALIRDRPRFQAGWNSSIGLPSGSSSWICFPPGPDSISLRKLKPCCFIAATRAGRSTTSTTSRFHPPGSCRRPSGIGLAPELPGPLSQRIRSPFDTLAKAGPAR